MKTSDKELDDLFNSKLSGFEAEPSANLWQNIAAELDGEPKKKSLIPVLRIAAGVLALLSVGLFWMQANKQLVQKRIPQKVAKVKLKPVQKEEIVRPKTNVRQKTMLPLMAKNKSVKEPSHQSARKLAVIKSKEKPELKAAETVRHSINQNNQPEQLAVLPQNKAVVPDENVALKLQTAETSEEIIKAEPVLTAKTKPETVVVKRKGIRNVGDLVNLVMAKVDKRPNKLIEFSNNDDGDESNVTGINLGIISIKKEK